MIINALTSERCWFSSLSCVLRGFRKSIDDGNGETILVISLAVTRCNCGDSLGSWGRSWRNCLLELRRLLQAIAATTNADSSPLRKNGILRSDLPEKSCEIVFVDFEWPRDIKHDVDTDLSEPGRMNVNSYREINLTPFVVVIKFHVEFGWLQLDSNSNPCSLVAFSLALHGDVLNFIISN